MGQKSPPYTYPILLFSTFWIFPSFLLKINAILMRYEIWKGWKKVSQKAGSRSIASNSMRFTIYTTETDGEWASFFSVDYPNHTLAGGVSVNSLCQQGINRHADIKKRTVRASTGNSRWTKHTRKSFGNKNIVVNRDICIRMGLVFSEDQWVCRKTHTRQIRTGLKLQVRL